MRTKQSVAWDNQDTSLVLYGADFLKTNINGCESGSTWGLDCARKEEKNFGFIPRASKK